MREAFAQSSSADPRPASYPVAPPGAPPHAAAFTAAARDARAEQHLLLTSVGIDIGSSTAHLVFSRVRYTRVDARYVRAEADVFHESPILLTPYSDAERARIDGARLSRFVRDERRAAGLVRDDVGSGAVILTGVAAQRENAAEIARALAQEAGGFVTVAAGDVLEAVLAAHGSGAVEQSQGGEAILCIDIGGATTKLSLCTGGRVAGATAVDAGARLLSFDDAEEDAGGAVVRVTHLEPALRSLLRRCGHRLQVGDAVTSPVLEDVADLLAEAVVDAVPGGRRARGGDRAPAALRLPALPDEPRPDRVLLSGGVAEYMGGRDAPEVGDLGRQLARAVETRLQELGVPFDCAPGGIRATVAGAAVDTVQLSGSTVFVDPVEVLPLTGLPVITPEPASESHEPDVAGIEDAVRTALAERGLSPAEPVGVALRWRGTASFDRLDALCRGLTAGLRGRPPQVPVVLLVDGDVGGLLGMQLRDTPGFSGPIVSIDGIALQSFDVVDVGAFLPGSGAVPLTVKSLLFAGRSGSDSPEPPWEGTR